MRTNAAKSAVKSLAIAACLTGVVFAGLAVSRAQEAMSFTTTGSSAQGFMKLVVEALHAVVREDHPNASATFRPSSIAGGLAEAAAGKSEFVIAVPYVELSRGLKGEKPFPKPLEGELTAALTLITNLDFYWVADGAWAKKNGITSIKDIAAKKPKMTLNLNELGTFHVLAGVDEIFKAYGFTVADIKKWGGDVIYTGSSSHFNNLHDGKVDMIVSTGFTPDGRIGELARSRDIVWLQIDKEVIEKVAPTLGMTPQIVPKAAYPFMAGDANTMAVRLTTVASTKVPEATVYNFVKALGEHTDRVQAIHPSMRGFSVAQMATKPDDLPWHPGALKYYREKGLVK